MKVNQFTKKWLQVYHEKPDDLGGEEGSPLDVLDADLPGNEGDEPTTGDDPDEPTTGDEPEPEPESKGFDPDKLAEAMLRLSSGVQAKNKPEQKQLTPEEARKMLQFWEPDDDVVNKLNNVETAKEALASIRDGLTRQFVAILQAYTGDKFGEMDSKYAPLLDWRAQQEATAREGRFYDKYEQLKDPKFKPVLDAVFGQIVKEGKQFKSEDEIFAAAAKRVEAVAKQFDPNFKLTGAKAPSKPGNPNALKPTRPGAAKGGSGQGSGKEQASGKGWLASHL